MSGLVQNKFYVYDWYKDDKQTEITSLRLYGLNDRNQNVCVHVDDFLPYIYIELPEIVDWEHSSKHILIVNKIKEIVGVDKQPLMTKLVWRKKLYGAFLDSKGKYKLFPYLLCSFSSKNDYRNLIYKCKSPIYIGGLGNVMLKLHETDANEVLQLTCERDIHTAGWIKFYGKKRKQSETLTLCDYEYDVKYENLHPIDEDLPPPNPKIMGFDIEVNSSIPSAMPQSDRIEDVVFQISCVFSRYGDTSDKYVKYLLTLGEADQIVTGEDVIIQEYTEEYYLLLGFTELIRKECPNLVVGYNILCFDIPYMIDRTNLGGFFPEYALQGFHKYNCGKIETIKWSSSAYKNQEFKFLGLEGIVFIDLLPLVKRDFKFNNYKLKTISEHFIGETKDPLSVKGIFKCYRIGTKTNENGEYTEKSRKAMGIVGKYCVQDTALCILLMDKLQTWIGLTEMAKTCRVGIFTLYTQGQQIKVYSQLYYYCSKNKIVVEKDGYISDTNERYVGAHVFPPVPGMYENVVPFDFSSLYPTTIIAYNIDYHTWVPEGESVPDRKCHVMKWEDHIGCEHDPKIKRISELTMYIMKVEKEIKVLREKRDKLKDRTNKKLLQDEINELKENIKPQVKERSEINKSKPKRILCAKRKYRFLKEPKGVLPTVIQHLLDARKHTRSVDIKKCKEEIKRLKDSGKDCDDEIDLLNRKINVLDKRQLAYKVSANSMYGAMGVTKGYLPFMPGAMCTTFMGRTNIERVADTIVSKYKGELVYGDTDSNYIYFPEMEGKSSVELWDWAEYVADEVTKLFPPPIKLEFEEALYSFFFILTKKRYMYRAINSREGEVDMKIGKKGVLLARRDNSKFVRDVYEGVIQRIADGVKRDEVVLWILNEIDDMYTNRKPHTDFIVTKSVGDDGEMTEFNDDMTKKFNDNFKLESIITENEKGDKRYQVGDYMVPYVPEDDREDKFKKKGVDNLKDFILTSLPAQVQLAIRLRNRGQRVDKGSRIEYVITNPDKHNGKQYEKIECADYYNRHRKVIKLDYHYYLKALTNPLDQVLDVAYNKDTDWKPEMILNQYKYRSKDRVKLLNSIKNRNKKKIIFE